jgi:glycosyltransferase involved in cell wall biosynthesis
LVPIQQAPDSRITVIIPTLCEAVRVRALLRAIESIQHSSAKAVRVVVVVNGQRFDPDLLERLKQRRDIGVLQLAEGSQTLAQRAGRASVETEFFSFLDDDDEYLPGAIDDRLALLDAHPDAALAVSNGLICGRRGEAPLFTRMARVPHNPLMELFEENWLHNCNATFRTAMVPLRYFEDSHSMMEWTWLAFRLAMDGLRVVTSDALAFRYNDTPGSLSKTARFTHSRTTLYLRMLAMRPPPEVQETIRKRMCAAWHQVSLVELGAGNRSAALGAHWRSLTSHISGLRYLSFTRYLLRGRAATPAESTG